MADIADGYVDAEHYPTGPGVGHSLIIAYDSRSERFSRPIRVPQVVCGLAPRGEYLYLAGRQLSRVAKKFWVTDQPGVAADAPLGVRCPDPDLGLAEASVALCHRDFDKAKECLGTVPESRVSAKVVSRMRQALEKLRREPAAAPADSASEGSASAP